MQASVDKFQIHHQLVADCHYVGKFKICHLLLHKNSLIPWFILVPETNERDFLALEIACRNAILDECTVTAEYLKKHFQLQKINFATIGNVVHQLHLHVVGRHEKDCCWPRPVWGNLATVAEYTEEQIEKIRQLFFD